MREVKKDEGMIKRSKENKQRKNRNGRGRRGDEGGGAGGGRAREETEREKNQSSKHRTWSAVPDALLGVISCRSGVRTGQRPQRADVL